MANVYYKLYGTTICYYCNTQKSGYSLWTNNQASQVSRGTYYTLELTDGKFIMPKNCSYMFFGSNDTFSSATNIVNFDKADWSEAEVFDYMFQYASITYLDMSKIDVSHATSLKSMFRNAYSSENNKWNGKVDLSSWDVSNVTNMSYMFQGFGAKELNLTGWDVSNVTNMDQMFSNCHISGPVVVGDNIDWSRVTSATSDAMFNNASTKKDGKKDYTITGDLTIARANTKSDGYFLGEWFGFWVPHEVWIKEDDTWHRIEVYK